MQNEVQRTEKSRNIKDTQQYDSQLQAESQIIEMNVRNLIEKFIPPYCKNCTKRRADRVCVKKQCGPTKYLQLICGKCHADSHSKATKTPEIDVQEYFVRLAIFQHQKKLPPNTEYQLQFNTNTDKIALNDIDCIRAQLRSLKNMIGTQIERNETDEQAISQIQTSFTKALSCCEGSNIYEQLREIKKRVVFIRNQFILNCARYRYDQFLSSIHELENIQKQLLSNIKPTLLGNQTIDLNELYVRGELQTGKPLGSANIYIKGENNVITINPDTYSQRQMFLDYVLDAESVYRLRFTFLVDPQEFVVIGIMPVSVVTRKWITVEGHTLQKNFINNEQEENCNRIIKGGDLHRLPRQGDSIEMRIDMKNKYIDFADYPHYQNVYSNHAFQEFKSEPYVIVIMLIVDESISIDSFEIIPKIIDR